MLPESPKILILRLSSIGDILLSSPFIRQTRKTFPGANISFIVKKEFADLIRYNPHINTIYEFDSSSNYENLKKLNRQIKTDKYDLIFDLHNNLRTRQILSGLNASSIHRISKSKIKRAMLVYFKLNLYKRTKPIAERYLDVGKSSGISDDGLGLELFWDGATDKKINELNRSEKLADKYLCLAPGAAHFSKMWPLDYSIKLTESIIEKTDYTIVILGGPAEKSMLNCFPQNERIINFTGTLKLLESAALLAQSKGIITNDTGLMHMASAVNVPILALFGSTVKELGFFPYRSKSSILENNKVWCRPCSHIGRSHCPLDHFKCMRDISVNQVFEKTMQKIIKQ
jgi:lipopolysaccharide heptosyltransferase II